MAKQFSSIKHPFLKFNSVSFIISLPQSFEICVCDTWHCIYPFPILPFFRTAFCWFSKSIFDLVLTYCTSTYKLGVELLKNEAYHGSFFTLFSKNMHDVKKWSVLMNVSISETKINEIVFFLNVFQKISSYWLRFNNIEGILGFINRVFVLFLAMIKYLSNMLYMLFNFRVMNINMKAMLFVSQVSFDNYVPEGVVQKFYSNNVSKFTRKNLCQSFLLMKLLKRPQHAVV